MISKIQQQVPPRTLVILLLSIWLLTGLAAYLYLFKKPLDVFLKERSHIHRLGQNPTPRSSLDEEIQTIQKQIGFYQEKLNQGESKLSLNLMIAKVIGKLDRIAKQQSARLISIEPRNPTPVLLFEELPFSIEVEGTYFSLYKWLQAVEDNLQPMVIKEFQIHRGKSDEQIKMSLTLVSYRLKF